MGPTGLSNDLENPYNDTINFNKKEKKLVVRQPFPVKKTTIDRIIYPVYTKRGIKYGKKRAIS